MDKKGYQYLETLAPWAGRGDFSLEGIKKVLNVLGDPQDKIPSIHVAGTNGKGSTSAFIAAGLGAAGFRVGLNISPHLDRINERFVIDGLAVSDEWIDENAQIVKEVAQQEGILLSFHEALTAIAFVGFANEGLDYMVIEVGLGGLLDASNVIRSPKACVITSIGLDHQDILGKTIPEIAKQKGGIIKNGSNVFIGPLDSSSLKVIEDISLEHRGKLKIATIPYQYRINLLGEHQRFNASIAESVLSSLNVDKATIEKGLENAFWPARLEYPFVEAIGSRKLLIDCAHNPQGIEALVKYLSQNSISKVHLIFGTLNTKDWQRNIEILKPYISTFAYLAPDSAKSLPGNTICDYIGSQFSFTELSWNKEEILNYINKLDCNTLILLTGSIYTVGKLRSLLDIKDKPLWIRKR